jgi:hypothetical protein
MRDFVEAHTVQIVLSVLAFTVVLIVLGIISAVRRSKRRRATLREWSFRNGFDYAEGPTPAYDIAPLGMFEIKDEITRSDALNITRGSRVTIFDHQETTKQQSGPYNNRVRFQTKTRSCALYKLAEPLPEFDFSALTTAAPDTFQGKLMAKVIDLAKMVGGKPGVVVPIGDRPGFLLRGIEADRIAPLFAEGRAHFFDDKCGWSVESHDSWLLVSCDPSIYQHGWERGSPVSEKNYDDFVRISQQIHDHFATS